MCFALSNPKRLLLHTLLYTEYDSVQVSLRLFGFFTAVVEVLMRQRMYSLGETCALLAVDAVTLRRWMRRVHMTPMWIRPTADGAASISCNWVSWSRLTIV
jgi:hypothetical protein